MLKKKLQTVITAYEYFGLVVSLAKCVVIKISNMTGAIEKIRCDNHEIKTLESFKCLTSKLVANRSVKDGVIEIICSKM
jgi:hypothetical protein